jgi:drug/metabolite transporter (DMT)-like permease
MSPSWIFLALSATILASMVNLLDSHFVSRRMPDWRAYVLICDVFSLPISFAMIFIFPLPAAIGWPPLLAILGSVLILRAMKTEEISRISPLTSTSPVFVAILAMLFLSEAISLQQWLAIVAVVAGVFIISFNWNVKGSVRFHARPVLLLSIASLFVAIGSVSNKYALGFMSYWNSAALIFIISSLIFIGICLRRDVLRQLATMENHKATISLALAGQVVAMVASILSFWSVKLGPVALVSTIYSSKPVFVFAFSSITGRLAPRFMVREPGNRRLTLIRLSGTLVVVGGLVSMLL